MEALVKYVKRRLLGRHQIFCIYEYDLSGVRQKQAEDRLPDGFDFGMVTADAIACAADEGIRERASYDGDQAVAFAISTEGEIVCLQWYWFGDTYRRRNFWPLEEDEAKSIDLFTAPEFRGKGLATLVKDRSALAMKRMGFRKLYSRIWHSNRASRRVSEKAGWQKVALVVEAYPFGLGKKIRLVRRT